jgi:hypothetical protein
MNCDKLRQGLDCQIRLSGRRKDRTGSFFAVAAINPDGRQAELPSRNLVVMFALRNVQDLTLWIPDSANRLTA